MQVEVVRVPVVPAAGGGILKILNRESYLFQEFGELYFSQISTGVFRGWKIHTKLQSLLFVIEGEISLHVINPDSSCETITLEKIMDSNTIVKIPAGVAFGFRSVSSHATIGNFASLMHDPSEVVRPRSDYHKCEWLA
jgi:dTDP-4-dehydrorhamnose 3,5-epimerase-like enzyme